MNQRDLYDSLSYAGCQILTFEDYPADFGSWRVNFIFRNLSCEVSCNRRDSLITFTSKGISTGHVSNTYSSRKLVSDQLEIGKVSEWIRTLKGVQLNTMSISQYETLA